MEHVWLIALLGSLFLRISLCSVFDLQLCWEDCSCIGVYGVSMTYSFVGKLVFAYEFMECVNLQLCWEACFCVGVYGARWEPPPSGDVPARFRPASEPGAWIPGGSARLSSPETNPPITSVSHRNRWLINTDYRTVIHHITNISTPTLNIHGISFLLAWMTSDGNTWLTVNSSSLWKQAQRKGKAMYHKGCNH